MEEKIGSSKVPRWQIIEGKILGGQSRADFKIEAERKYYDYVKQTLDAIESFGVEESSENQTETISEENSKLKFPQGSLTINGKKATEVFKVPKLTPGQRKKV